MKRLLTSSRFQATLLAVIALVAIAFGVSEDKADALAGSIVGAITILTGILTAGTSLEDAAKKFRGLKCLLPMLLMLPLAGMIGCQITDPGGQTQTALRQDTQFGWGTEANPYAFTAGLVGSQTGAFEMFEGGRIVRKPDGTIDWEKSESNCYLRYEPKADAAASAFDRAYAESTRQVDRLSQLTENLVGALVSMRVAQITAESARQPLDNLSAGISTGLATGRLQPADIDRIIETLERLRGNPPPGTRPAP